MVWPAVIAAAATIYGAYSANRASAKQAAQQMDFQERMSRTAHQREVTDLRAAGLNPILSGTGGRGASTPGGAQAPQRSITEGAAATALAITRQKQELKNMKSQDSLLKAQKQHTDMSYVHTQYLAGKEMFNARAASTNALLSQYQQEVELRAHHGNLHQATLHSSKAADIQRIADRVARGISTYKQVLPWGRRPKLKHQ